MDGVRNTVGVVSHSRTRWWQGVKTRVWPRSLSWSAAVKGVKSRRFRLRWPHMLLVAGSSQGWQWKGPATSAKLVIVHNPNTPRESAPPHAPCVCVCCVFPSSSVWLCLSLLLLLLFCPGFVQDSHFSRKISTEESLLHS